MILLFFIYYIYNINKNKKSSFSIKSILSKWDKQIMNYCEQCRNDGILDVALSLPFELSDNFIKDLKLIDKEVKKIHNRYSE